jgi:glycosyltransferase involved in cell wall biosynthesis
MVSAGEKIKLLILIPSLQCGGSEKYVATLCNNIDTQKFDVTLAVVNNAAAFYTITNTVVKLIDLEKKAVRHSFFAVRKLVKKIKPDIIYSNANHLNLYFAIFKKQIAGNTLLVARESSIVSINSKRAKFPAAYQWLIKRFYKKLDHIICQSAYMQNDLIVNYNIDKNKTVVINNAVEEHAVMNNHPQKNKFISVGRLSPEKGIERILQALAKLDTDFTYYIIGDGDTRESLQKLANELQLQNKVFFTGQKDHPFKGMEDAELFLMGSFYEGFPNALLEAGSYGIPVVAFNAPGGIREIITGDENGLLVKEGDIVAFAAAITKAGSMQFNRAIIKEQTQRRFSIQNIIDKTAQVFEQFII